jgi:hypothetical protein
MELVTGIERGGVAAAQKHMHAGACQWKAASLSPARREDGVSNRGRDTLLGTTWDRID